MPFHRPLLSVTLLMCISCSQAPRFGEGLTEAERNAPFPDLIPLTTLLAGEPASAGRDDLSGNTLAGRVASLRARATALAGPVVDPDTRALMRAGVARAALR